MPQSNHIIIVAGEASGDLHAAHLVKALKSKAPSLIFSGLGGPQLKNEGVHVYEDLTRFAVVGFTEVLKHYSEFKRIFKMILDKIDGIKPAAVILVDYPGFNLRLAKEIKRRGIPVIYYISPQVWAWKKNRVQIIRKYVDRMLVLFPFEKTFYQKMGLDVDFIGHPLVDTVRADMPKAKFLESIGFKDYQFTIGLLPGSRMKEIERHLPAMLASAEILTDQFPMMQFLVVKAPTVPIAAIEKYTKRFSSLRLKIVQDDIYNAIQACDICIVASGTATLETALLLKPMVVVYKTSWLTWLLAKCVIRIPDIALVNVVAGKRIVPECLQLGASPQRIAQEIKSIITNELRLEDMKNELRKIRGLLGESRAVERAADKIFEVISKK